MIEKFLLSMFVLTNCLLASSCANRLKYFVSQFDSQDLGYEFINKLQERGVDTIILYRDAGYMDGSENSSYVYWVDNGNDSLTEFTQYAIYNVVSAMRDFQIGDTNYLKNLLIEPLKRPPGLMDVSHCPVEKILLKINNNEVGYTIDCVEDGLNDWTQKKIYIDRFRSFLFRNESYLHPVIYKLKKNL